MAKRMDYSGSPQPGKAGLNYDHVFTPKKAGVDAAPNSRAKPKMQSGSAASQPPMPSSRGAGRKPQHYGERAHTTIKKDGWPGAAAKRSTPGPSQNRIHN